MNRLLFATAALLATVSVNSAVANDCYDVVVQPVTAQKGQRAVATVSVRPKGAYHMNLEYPVKLTITAPAGITVEKAKQTQVDAKRFEKDALDFEVAFVSNASGMKSFSGELRFAVCTDTENRPTDEQVDINVDVK